jgi:hypothetical protein
MLKSVDRQVSPGPFEYPASIVAAAGDGKLTTLPGCCLRKNCGILLRHLVL